MSSVGCGEWHGRIVGLAQERLSDRDRLDLEAHLLVCDRCRRDVEELRSTLRLLGAADPSRARAGAGAEADVRPPPEVWDRILAATRVPQRSERHRRGWSMAALAVAAVVLALTAVILIPRFGTERATPPPGTAASATEVEFDTAIPGAEAYATVRPDGEATRIRLTMGGMPPGDYEIAVRRSDGTEVPAGASFAAPQGRWSGTRIADLPRDASATLVLRRLGGGAELTAGL